VISGSSVVTTDGGGIGFGSDGALLDFGFLTTSFLAGVGLGVLPKMSFGTALDRRRFCPPCFTR